MSNLEKDIIEALRGKDGIFPTRIRDYIRTKHFLNFGDGPNVALLMSKKLIVSIGEQSAIETGYLRPKGISPKS